MYPEPIITLKYVKDNGKITVILIFIAGQIKHDRSDTSGAGYTACVVSFSSFYTMVKLYNGGAFLAFCIVQIDNGSGADLALIY